MESEQKNVAKVEEKKEEEIKPEEVEELLDNAEPIDEEDEALKEKEKLEKEIAEKKKRLDFLQKKTKRACEKQESFKTPRTEFVFRFINCSFELVRFKMYIKGMVKNLAKKSGITCDVTEYKNVGDMIWFSTSRPIVIDWLKYQSKGDSKYKGFKIVQLRPDKVFNDYD